MRLHWSVLIGMSLAIKTRAADSVAFYREGCTSSRERSQMVGCLPPRGSKLLFTLVLGGMLPGCSSLHLYKQENALLAQTAKTTYTEKIDLLGLVTAERANFAKQKEAELAALKQSRVHERDRVFFDAAGKTAAARLDLLRLPKDDDEATKQASLTIQVKPGAPPIKPDDYCQSKAAFSYMAQRACALKAHSRSELAKVAASINQTTIDRLQLVENQRADLKKMGWEDVPACSGLVELKDGIPADTLTKIPADKQALAKTSLEDVQRDCHSLLEKLPPAYEKDSAKLIRLDKEKESLDKEAGAIQTKIKELADRLKDIASGTPRADDTRKKISEEASKVREAIDKLPTFAGAIGAEERLAELRIDGLTTLLLAVEGEKITDDMLKGESAEFREAIIVAQTFPQLIDDLQVTASTYSAPPKTSLLIALKQAQLDKEYVAARKELLLKRRELVLQRMAATATEARLLALAANQPADHADCLAVAGLLADDRKKLEAAACEARVQERIMLGFNFLSRSMLTARAEQEYSYWSDVHLGYEQQLIANEYALKSWNNLIGSPILVLEGYHTGGIKPEALADVITKLGGLGLFGIAVGKYTND